MNAVRKTLGQAYVEKGIIPANDNDEPTITLKSDTALSDLTDPGGVVSDIVDWIVSSSMR